MRGEETTHIYKKKNSYSSKHTIIINVTNEKKKKRYIELASIEQSILSKHGK